MLIFFGEDLCEMNPFIVLECISVTNLPSVWCEIAGPGQEWGACSALWPGTWWESEILFAHLPHAMLCLKLQGHLFASASPWKSLKGDICLCSSGGWYRTMRFARGKNFACNFLQPSDLGVLLSTWTVCLTCLSKALSVFFVCLFLLCASRGIYGNEKSWKILALCYQVLLFFLLHHWWYLKLSRCEGQIIPPFSVSANTCLSCQCAPTNPTACTEQPSWADARKVKIL